RRDPSVRTGRTGQGKLVHFAPLEGGGPTIGSFAEVEVTGAAPHHLTGRLGRVTAAPRHRPRLAVAAG
ncbi:MAG TPA: tRNA (N6-isopentenyl adenosine(37)-C2)-methylthiotransferase MiaB, partial [Acidimicrobiales bacterium]